MVGKVVLLLVIGAILQTVILSRFSVMGVTADLFLILTVIVAFSKGPIEGAVFGFVAGIVADMIYYGHLGMRALVYVLVGYCVGLLVMRFETINVWAVMVLTAVSSFCGQLIYGIFQYVMTPRSGFVTMVWRQMIPEAVFDALVAILVYVLLVRLRVFNPKPREAKLTKEGTE
jgi:rod shape-determining protein MreD